MLPITIKCYPTSSILQDKPLSSLNILSGLYHCIGSSSPQTAQCQSLGPGPTHPSQSSSNLINSPHTASLASWKKGRYTYLLLFCYGSYNQALNKTEKKSSVHIIKCYTDMLPALMGPSYVHHSPWFCMRAGITAATFVSPTVLCPIKYVSKGFQWKSK